MVEEHYTGLGFTKIEGAITAQYELNLDNYKERESYIIKKQQIWKDMKYLRN